MIDILVVIILAVIIIYETIVIMDLKLELKFWKETACILLRNLEEEEDD